MTPKIFNQTYSLVTQRVYKLCIRNIWKQAADNVAPSGMDLLSLQQSLQNQTNILTVKSETLKNSATQYIVPIPMPLIVWETVIVTVSSLSSMPWSWLYLYHFFFALLLFASFLVLSPSPLAFIAIFLLVCLCVWFVFVCLFSTRDSVQDLLNSVSNQCVAELLPCQETSLVVYMCFCFVL